MNYKSILISLCFCVLALLSHCQTRVISGVLTDSNGDPLPGVNIIIKGTTTGTVSDLDGYYSIEAPVGSTLVYSYVGFLNEEVLVTPDLTGSDDKRTEDEKNIEKSKNSKILKSPGDLKKNIPGTVSMNIISGNKSDRLIRKYCSSGYYYVGNNNWWIKGSIHTGISTEHATRLPDFQKTYSQGRNENGTTGYFGPETGEIFSWGPPIRNLEYDGSDYEYDPRGRLVSLGSGNGTKAVSYDPFTLFKPGHTFSQYVKLMTGYRYTKVQLAWNLNSYEGILPKSALKKNNLIFELDQRFSEYLNFNMAFHYLNSNGDLMNCFSQSRINAMMLQTPHTFDNAYGLSSSDAVNTPYAYLLSDGSQRNFARGSSDNPYWLINTIRDNEKIENIFGMMKFQSHVFDRMNLNLDLSGTGQKVTNDFGFAPGTLGIEDGTDANRSDGLNTFYSGIKAAYMENFYLFSINMTLQHQFNYFERRLRVHRNEIITGPGNGTMNSTTSRNTNNLSLSTVLNFDETVIIDASLSQYRSSGLAESHFIPHVGIGFRLSELFYMNAVNNLKILGSYSESVHEAPLQFQRGLLNTTLISSTDFFNYFENGEIINDRIILPERSFNTEVGTEMGFFYNRLVLSAFYFRKNQKDFIYPVFIDDRFELQNVADLTTSGFDMEINYQDNYLDDVRISIGLNFHTYRSRVSKLMNENTVVGGFADVPAKLIEGEEFGVISGSTYERNNLGQMIIGPDGFPLISSEYAVIANPNPDWIAGLSAGIDYKAFTFSLLFDFRYGGQTWNGTSNTLNYLGIGKITDEGRLVRDYIFPGVKEDGTINNTTVHFYDSGIPLEENRWVRYGSSGVAEEAVEDATSLRLREINITYHFAQSMLRFGSSLNLTAFAKNLFQISKYSGPDPKSLLMGFSHNLGYDYFNLPGVRSIGFAIDFTF